MPLYDYRCPQGHRFEKLASIAAGACQDCPACGQASGKVPSLQFYLDFRTFRGGRLEPVRSVTVLDAFEHGDMGHGT